MKYITAQITVVKEDKIDGQIVFINIPQSGLINASFSLCNDPYMITEKSSVLV